MIYFVRSGDAVKIGYARAPDQRIPSLRTGNPNQLVTLGVMEGEIEDERALHERFARHRTRGEWFVLCDEIVKFIEQNARPCLHGVRRLGITPELATYDTPIIGMALFAAGFAVLGCAVSFEFYAERFDWFGMGGGRSVLSIWAYLIALGGLLISALAMVGLLCWRFRWAALQFFAERRYRRTIDRLSRG